MAALKSKASFLQGLPRPVIIMMTVKTLLKPTANITTTATTTIHVQPLYID